ncbi:prolipoprotein diacylglyceryl transferase [Vulgatibacter incomptus]|uniref:Prolipoprotein diacylglyceryl transferase n=1 Tax=Vulgatibacter incomptus TaxID=1391653 RepID=A0A0K1P9M0_9BACT|nr:prolipoprotein diacylglyceryl transferase family protein [Vulgatibacter incomptus]AKU90223.1 Prolipoprotein diacylglyceryl transferase [Vulgatibacter incomptus]
MIPYFQIPPLHVGPLELHAFGALSALGIYVGARLAARAARVYEPRDDRALVESSVWLVVGGVLGGHLMHVLGYHPEILRQDGLGVLLRVWEGQSSMGGLVGAMITLLVLFKVRGWKILPNLNAFALGLAPGWAIARLGCFAAHDHPGVLTSFPLAVAFPEGARHDLGLYEAILLGTLAGVLYLLARKPRPQGMLMGVLAIGYGVPRFFLDFLRASDLPFVDGRIFGLTPAQYVTFLLMGIGTWLLVRSRNLPAAQAPGTPVRHAA